MRAMPVSTASRAALIFSRSSYRVEAYLEAADRLGVELVLATDLPDAAMRFGRSAVVLDLADPAEAASSVVSAAPLHGVIATCEASAVVASLSCERLGLPHHAPEGARAAHDKRRMRERLRSAGFLSPRFRVLEPNQSPESIQRFIQFPCVVKPPMLSGSQGVIRADDPRALAHVVERVRALLGHHLKGIDANEAFFTLLIEDYLPGDEIAVEGIMDRGLLRVLAVFDKPDPLTGPYFEETLYVTPSRLAPATLAHALDVTASAARALGLVHGPIHAELRVHRNDAQILEIAARSIGGLCSRVLKFSVGSLEDHLVAHAVGLELPAIATHASARASGVMMMPIPRSGILRAVHGVEAARRVARISEVLVSVALGQTIRTLPEGSTYLGFIFARGETAEEVEQALRDSFAALRFEVSPLLPIAVSSGSRSELD